MPRATVPAALLALLALAAAPAPPAPVQDVAAAAQRIFAAREPGTSMSMVVRDDFHGATFADHAAADRAYRSWLARALELLTT